MFHVVFQHNEQKKGATERFWSRELHSQNKAMDNLANSKQDLQEHQSKFDFKIECFEHYRELKSKFEPEFMRAVFPEMTLLIAAKALIGNGNIGLHTIYKPT